MAYQVEVRFAEVYEFLSSLHTFICRPSHKKIDLTPAWAAAMGETLSPELKTGLAPLVIGAEWKLVYLLAFLCPDPGSVPSFLQWIKDQSNEDLYELTSGYPVTMPEDWAFFRSVYLSVLPGWYEEYFRSVDPAIPAALQQETASRLAEQPLWDADEFVDRTTGGMRFRQTDAMERLLLVPQYHFQPVNVVYDYGRFMICHYSSRIDLASGEVFPNPDLRLIRALGERSRLKILRYLHEGPRAFIEIVRHLKLSKGITHDHIFKLRSSGLICAHFAGETLVEYSLRSRSIMEFQQSLMSYITGSSEMAAATES
ncbi:winged helix-turn-helix domain-containing protein [Paenibacillus medicaginis]|uniref:Winged helix-turn-helix domain-containing protein n=1 Tax=Paenibacillus medicaginis TaxID=1470560 RepID=A0ABV5BYX0_9BACL